MRCVYLAAACVLSAVVAPSVGWAQAGATGLSITNYQFVSEQRASGNSSYVVYRADLVNPGVALGSATATLMSLDPFTIRVMPGLDTLNFAPVPAGGQVASHNTFTILVDRTIPFDPKKLQWSFQTTAAGPVANAGRNQLVQVGGTVTLDGSGSTNPSGAGALTYSWTFASRPVGTRATLATSSVMPTFVADVAGAWIITLTVSNGVASDSASVTVSTLTAPPPVANAGPDQTAIVGATVTLDGGKSTSGSGNPLTYSWSLIASPAGSTAALAGAQTIAPGFVPDKMGAYVAQLIVNDGARNSTPSNVTVAIQPQVVKPVAVAGPNQHVNVKNVVQLDGSKSTDANGLPLTYQWSLMTMPRGSAAALSNSNAVNPTLIADVPGTYIAQLIVNNGTLNSPAAAVTIATDVLAPTANAGTNQTVNVKSLVILTGSGTDPQNLPLTLLWALINKPAGSAASLSSNVIANPIFVADLPGSYVAQLVVGNGFTTSAPATVTISTTCAPPTANAGANRIAAVGATVTLDGSASGDVCQDPLTYAWSFTARPAGSAATLSGADTVSPSFVVDVPGTYVAQVIVNNGFTNSAPATVTIATPPLITLTPNPLTLGTNATATLTVTLAAPAGNGGQVINLSSSDTNAATVPAAVTVPQGAASANVTVTTGNASGSAIITGAATGFTSGTATVNVVSVNITLALDSGTLVLGTTMQGTVTLTSPAPPGGVSVTLASNPAGIVETQPATVTIADGGTKASFTVSGKAKGHTTIGASSPGYNSGSAGVTVQSAGSIGVPANPVTVELGKSAAFPVSLPQAAPTGGVTVTLTSGDLSKVTVTPSVFIAAGSTAPSTQPQVTGIAPGSTAITASSSSYDSGSQTAQVTATLSFSPASLTVPLSTTQNLKLNLSAPAPAGGLTVNLSSDNTGAATVPGTVNFAAGATSVNVPVTGIAEGSATIHASAPPNVADTAANVTVSISGTLILPANATAGLSQSAPFTVTLSSAAGPGGVTVALASSDTSKVTVSPSSVVIAAGATTPATQPQVTGVNLGTANITASAPGYAPVTQPVQVTATISFSPASLTINGFVAQNLTLNLSSAAPAGGLTVNLSSDSTSVATVPLTVTFAAKATSTSVPVTGVGGGSAVIHASALPNLADTTANVTVVPPASILLPANTTVALGQSTTISVTLPSAAPPGGVTVTLVSSDPSKVTAPPGVFIAAGATTPATEPQVNGINVGSAGITASAPGYSAGAGQVQVTAAINFSPSSATILGTATQNLTLNLSAPTPAPLVVNLSSSNPGAATVPPIVTFAANAATVNVPVTGVAPGSAVIHASALPNVADTTAGITVNPGAINVPANALTVGLGQSVAFPVSLGTAAPAGGVTLTLTSGDPAKATVTPSSVVIPQGATTPPTQPQVKGVNFGTATITASASGYTPGSQTVQVNGSIGFTPANLTLSGTSTQNLTLTLSGPAPAGGITVNVSSSNPAAATVPSTATFAANATTVSVPVTGIAPGSTTIHASAPPNLADTAANVTVSVDILTPANVTILPGQQANFSVTLVNPAPAGGVFIALTSSDTSKVTVSPANIFIGQGLMTPSSTPIVNGINVGSATITASAFGLQPAAQTVQVAPVVTLSFSPASLVFNTLGTQNLTLKLSALAPSSGLAVNVKSDNTGVATVLGIVFFPPNGQSVAVPVTSLAAGTAVIRASALPNIPEVTASVSVALQSVGVPANTTVPLGLLAPFPVTLSAAAPAGGVTVNLVSGDPTKVTVTPATVFIPAGATQPATEPQMTGSGIGSTTVTASASGYGSGTGTVTVPPPVLTFTVQSLMLNVGTQGLLVLNLAGGLAPAGGLMVTLSSSNPAVASVPATIVFPPGGISVPVPVMGLTPGSASITACATGVACVPVPVTVITLPPIGVPVNTSVGLGQSATFAVTLPQPAEADLTVALVSSDTSKVTVTPASITILQGATQPATQPLVTGAGIGSATITASTANNFSPGIGTVTVPTPVMSFAGPVTLNAGAQGNLTLNLTGGQAPAGGLTVNLNSDNTNAATVPATVNFPAGATSVPVTVTGGLVQSTQPATITASAAGLANATAIVTMNPLGGIVVSSASVGLNQSTALTVTLPVAAPAGGVTVSLSSSDNTKVTVSPASVTIAAGSTAPATQVQVTGVGAGTANIAAAAPGYTSGSGAVTVTPLVMSFSPPALTVGSNSQGTLTLKLTGGQAPVGGLTVNLSSGNTNAATVPETVNIAAGATSQAVTVTSLQVQATQIANITASATGLTSTTAQVTVTPLPTITIAPVTVGLGQTANLQVTLEKAATSDLTITLASSDTTKVTVSPAAITILKDATQPATAPRVTGLAAGSPAATISASATNYATGSGAVNVTVAMSFSQTSVTVNPGAQATLTLTLTGGQAPPAGLTVNLNSSNPAAATVPAAVSFAAGATSQAVTVTGVAGGTSTITASAANITSATATVIVPSPISVGNASVGLGQSASLQVSLAQPAASAVTITLASSDATKVTVSPATIAISQGATTPATAPQVTGAGIGSASITATAAGFISGSGPVTVTPPTMTFSLTALTVNPGAQGTLTLNLTGGQAPAGGLTVNLNSSDATKATVPATVSFAAGATSATVTVTGLASGTSTITASAAGIAATTAAVTVPTQIGVANVSMGLGQTANLQVTLSAPAASAVTLTLASSDSTKVTVSPATITIAQGATAPATAPQVTAVAIGSANLTAAAAGFISGSGTVTVTPPMMTLSPATLTVNPGAQGTLTVNLASGQAPGGGLTVNLNSSATGVATVPATVSFAAGATSAPVTVTAVASGNSTITASAANIAPATATVMVLTPIGVGNISVGLGLSANLQVSLAQPAASAVTITLASGDIPKVTVSPATITIPQGATTPATAPQVTGAGIGSANITATASGYAPGTGTVTVPAPTLTFSGSPLALILGSFGNLTLTLTGGRAPAGGLTVSLSSDNISAATVPGTVTFPANATSMVVTVTAVGGGSATITASAPNIAPAMATVNVTQPFINVANVSLGLGQQANLQVTLSAPATAGVTVNLTSGDTTKVTLSPASVFIPQGATAPASQPQVTGAGIGSSAITASAAGYTPGSGTVTVSPPTMTFSPANVSILVGNTTNLTLTLTSGQAPASGLTVNLSSTNTSAATAPPTVTFGAGAIAANVTVTGVGAGMTTITASAPNIMSTTATVTVSLPSISVASGSLGLGQQATLQVTLSQAPAAPLTVNLISSNSTKVSIAASVVIPQGATTPVTQPTVTGNGIGQATISASAAGYLTGTGTVSVPPPTLAFSPASLTVNAGSVPGILKLSLTGGQAPASGLTVGLISNATSVATVPGTVTFPAGSQSVDVPVTGVGAGFSMISAFSPGIVVATAMVNVQVVIGDLTVAPGVSVGQNLQTPVTISVAKAVMGQPLDITVTSGDPSKLLLAARATDAGTAQTSVTIPVGGTSIAVIVQGLGSSGTVNLSAAAPNYNPGSSLIALTPSGFMLMGPGGVSPITTYVGAAATALTLNSARLDSGLNFKEIQPVRGGFPAMVNVNSLNTNVGTASSPVTFAGGAASAAAQFTATAEGATLLTAVGPAGFSTPVSGNAVTFNVLPKALVPSNLTVGKNLQKTTNIALAGGFLGSLQITVTSNNPSLMNVSCPPGASPSVCSGSGPIFLTVQAGRTITSDFAVTGLAGSGTATYSATASGFVMGTGTVTLAPSGFVIAGPSGVGVSKFFVFTLTPNISVAPALLDSSLNFVEVQTLAAGLSATVNVSSSNPAVGTVSPPALTVTGGTNAALAIFQRGGSSGDTVLSVNTPAGFSTPAQDTAVTATVPGSSFALSCDGINVALIGQNLQMSGCTASLAQAGGSDVTVTIASDDPAKLLVSTSDTVAGSGSITVTIPAGTATSNAFTLQSLASSGTATYTAKAANFNDKTGTVALAPSGVVFMGPFFSATVSGGPVPVTVFTAALNPDNTYAATQPLRGGFSPLNVSLTSSNINVGTIASPVAILAGSDHAVAPFTPKSPGVSTISLSPPAGFVGSTNHTSIGAQVTP